jgi:phospholipid/cholesterol/gamma-HCH transport system substrate-binding protein
MRISHTAAPALRGGVVVAFVALCAVIFGFLWTNAGGKIPLVTQSGYEVTVPLTDVDNLVFQSDVRIAGVNVGKVDGIETVGRQTMVTVELDESVAPLHEGSTVSVRNKTMIEETYLEFTDGTGPEYASGSELPADAVEHSVQLNDVLTSLDDGTRRDLSKVIRSSGAALGGTREDVDLVLAGLGDLGDNAGALEALAEQSADLRALTLTSTQVLDALDVQQGRIVDLVRDSQRLTQVTSDHDQDVEALMRALPPLLGSTRTASASLERLADPLGVVATNLRGSSTDLNAALLELPATTNDLRGLLPSLDTALTRAPETLRYLPPLQSTIEPLVSTLEVNLADLNPMLAYLQPYGRDMVSYWSNFVGFASGRDVNGRIARVKPVFSLNTLNLGVPLTPGTMYNPYPAPGSLNQPRDFTGSYPHVEEDPIPR